MIFLFLFLSTCILLITLNAKFRETYPRSIAALWIFGGIFIIFLVKNIPQTTTNQLPPQLPPQNKSTKQEFQSRPYDPVYNDNQIRISNFEIVDIEKKDFKDFEKINNFDHRYSFVV
jgi:hypothetical protein